MRLLVVGASGGIGFALVGVAKEQGLSVLTASRSVATQEVDAEFCGSVWQEDERFESWLSKYQPDAVISCSGMLSSIVKRPEKKLQELDVDFFEHNMRLNCLSHLRLARSIERVLSRQLPLKMLCLSARVGSITDNGMGGWYSYRMSKASLNMGVKSVAIEWQRTRPNWSIAAVHPGTTDTQLSAPFQRSVADNMLYSPALTATRMLKCLEGLNVQKSGVLLNWDGTELPF